MCGIYDSLRRSIRYAKYVVIMKRRTLTIVYYSRDLTSCMA